MSEQGHSSQTTLITQMSSSVSASLGLLGRSARSTPLHPTPSGVKKPPISRLVDNKVFVFFSHTIKAQEENMKLLDAVLDKALSLLLIMCCIYQFFLQKVCLVDYEKIVNENGQRLVAFGQYAGITGRLDALVH